MNYGTTAMAVSSSGDDIVRVIITIFFLAVIGLAFPAAQAWAKAHPNDNDTSAGDEQPQSSRREMLSLQPQWVLRQGRKIVESFDDETEATREFARRITTKATPT